MLTLDQYAVRAAEKFLEAWERQGGECYSVGCGITYAANMLGRVANARDGGKLPGGDFTWWADRYRAYALAILSREV